MADTKTSGSRSAAAGAGSDRRTGEATRSGAAERDKRLDAAALTPFAALRERDALEPHAGAEI